MRDHPIDEWTFVHRGHTFRARVYHDPDSGPPWQDADGHGPVSDWRRLEGHYPEDGRGHLQVPAGARAHARDRNFARLYDVAHATKIARRDQWGPVHCATCGLEAGGVGTEAYGTIHAIEPQDHRFVAESRGQTAARAVARDFEYLRSWCADEWHYVGVSVVLADEGEDQTEDYWHALWGIESTAGEYLRDVARDLAGEIMCRIEVAHPDVVLSEN